ncbi:sulfur relay protein TusB/DsrH [Halospina denitrificans]|uniref:Sulfur relay protein TusB/DsrH n=1 Tax=Halospina denitrificans TaxID=332522 RepID=A0A4R7JTB5_9GAMM|nr:DsrH/TusB family sulfur metabolism protein [Halospina denitrificans]TDT41510.1 sulfur relay protein TusB/DsrH [Halospina denitrificans]
MKTRLHILNKPVDHPRYRRCLEALEPGDVLVLMESGVLVLMDGAHFPSIMDDVQVYAMAEDLAVYSRMQALEADVRPLGYQGLIELVCRLGSPLNW